MIHFVKNQIKFSARHFVRHRSRAKQVFCVLGLTYGFPTTSISKLSLKEFTTLDNRGKHWCSQYILDLTTALAGHHQEGTRLGSAHQSRAFGQGQGDCFSSGWWFCPSYSAKAADDPDKHSLRVSANTQQAHAHHRAIASAGQDDSSRRLHHAQHKVLPVRWQFIHHFQTSHRNYCCYQTAGHPDIQEQSQPRQKFQVEKRTYPVKAGHTMTLMVPRKKHFLTPME